MKISCPKDSTHKQFSATAHVTEDWKVNAKGIFLETMDSCDSQTIHAPDADDLYTCISCGAEAKVEKD